MQLLQVLCESIFTIGCATTIPHQEGGVLMVIGCTCRIQHNEEGGENLSSILALPYSMQPFFMEYDASSEGIGTLLMQNQHMIAFEN
jgi:hypothetical protein